MAAVSVYTTSTGARRYRVRYRTPDGRQTDKRGFTTKDAAEKWASRVEVAKQDGTYVAPAAGRITVGELATQWYDSKIDVKKSSRERYRQTLEQQVLPVWERVPVGDVTTSWVQSWINELSLRSAPSTVTKAQHAMSMILAMAVRDRRVLANAATGVNLPRARKSDPVFLTADQAFTLAGCAGPGELPVLVLSQTGLRWGELAGMKVKRWDPARRRLRVAEAVTEVNGHVVWGTPKSHHLRSVAVAPWLAERIDAAVDGRGGDDLLFPSPQGSVLRNKNARRSWFDRAVVEAGVPRITPHDLRHTAASLAISAGANVKAVQRMLGHASAVMTLDLYGHLFEDDLDDVAARMPAPPVLAPVVGLSAVR